MIYVLTGLAYDENNRIEEREEYIYDESFDYTDVYESFVKLQCKNAQELFKNIPKDIFQLLIQVEECIETKDGIECIDVKNELWVKNPYYIRKDENTMTQIIKLIDVNVDGCGTDVDTYIQVEGPTLTNGVIARTKSIIEQYKETDPEWDTDTIIDVACEKLKKEGYKTNIMYPSYYIEF